MKKIMITSIFVLAMATNALAVCGTIHTGRCLVDHHPTHESKPIDQDTKDQGEISINSILDYFKVQIISIIG